MRVLCLLCCAAVSVFSHAFEKMSVGQLKEFLFDRNITSGDCFTKEDYVKKAKEAESVSANSDKSGEKRKANAMIDAVRKLQTAFETTNIMEVGSKLAEVASVPKKEQAAVFEKLKKEHALLKKIDIAELREMIAVMPEFLLKKKTGKKEEPKEAQNPKEDQKKEL
ncbi:MAG: uncharacterized protein A8A55_0256 [Amphiamblys sp. WSBS2006]|nr:MAG: uncharacterized protein A8A55_0256 [Amphiamblys sp. WSBS2006]